MSGRPASVCLCCDIREFSERGDSPPQTQAAQRLLHYEEDSNKRLELKGAGLMGITGELGTGRPEAGIGTQNLFAAKHQS